MRQFLILALSLALLGGCGGGALNPNNQCSQDAAVVAPVVAFVASPAGMACSNTGVMTTDFEGFIGSLGLCKMNTSRLAELQHMKDLLDQFNAAHTREDRGVIGASLCPLLVSWGVSKFVNNSERLTAWACKGSGLGAALTAACGFVPI